MQRSIEQRNAIKFYVKLNNFVTKTLDMLQKTNEKDSLPKAQVLRWRKVFKEGREHVDGEQCPSRCRS